MPQFLKTHEFDRALDLSDLDGSGVDDLDGVRVVRVEGFPHQTHHFPTVDGAGVVLDSDYIRDYKSQHVSLGGRLQRRVLGGRKLI
jgi:hypothetical protein